MKLAENGLEKHCGIVTVNKMQLGCMSEKGKTDDVFILRRLKEEYNAK